MLWIIRRVCDPSHIGVYIPMWRRYCSVSSRLRKAYYTSILCEHQSCKACEMLWIIWEVWDPSHINTMRCQCEVYMPWTSILLELIVFNSSVLVVLQPFEFVCFGFQNGLKTVFISEFYTPSKNGLQIFNMITNSFWVIHVMTNQVPKRVQFFL